MSYNIVIIKPGRAPRPQGVVPMHSRSAANSEVREGSPRRADARRIILDSAEALLVDDGYERFSIRRLTERCGYTAPTIYHHFGRKRGLIDALLEERFQRLLARARRVRNGGEPVAFLRALLEVFLRFGLDNPTHYRLLYVPRTDAQPPPPSSEKLRALLGTPLAELAAEGRLRSADVEEAVQCLWSMLHGLVALQINRPDYGWSPTLNVASIDALLEGLIRPGRKPRAHGPRRARS